MTRPKPRMAKGKVKLDLLGLSKKQRGKDGIASLALRDLRDLVEKQNGRPKAFQEGLPRYLQVEVRDDHLFSSLRRYIEALGGEMEIVARFGKQRVRLKGVAARP